MGKNLKRTVVAVIVILLFSTPTFIFAQSPPYPFNDAMPIVGPDGNTPLEEVVFIIDGLMIILLALGIVYVGKKWHEAHKKKAESPA